MKIYQKSRKIGYTYGSTSGIYSFRKKSIQFESLLEKSFLQTLEFNDMVLDVIEQPLSIKYTTIKGNQGFYTPDFLIYFKEVNYSFGKPIKPLLVEVKPTKRLLENKDELKPKFKAAIRLCSEYDYKFKIFNENRIKGVELDNIVFLNRYKDHTPNPDNVNIITTHLFAIGHTTIEHLLTHLYVTDVQKGFALSCLWHLILIKTIATDLKQPLNNKTIIWLNIEEEDLGVDL